MQSHCRSIEVLESSKLFAANCEKYGKRVTAHSKKLNFKEKMVHKQFLKPVRSVSYDHHIPKALATSDVSLLKTSENAATYRFMTETGGQLKALIKKKNNNNNNNNKYELHVEVESLHHFEGQGELYMIWGLFTNNSTNLNTIETPFAINSVGNKLSVELEFDETLSPFYVSFLLELQSGSTSKTSTIRSHRKTNFVVPVGFGSGRPYPLGISFSEKNGFVNFAFFSRNAERVVLCLYADTGIDKPTLEIDLDPYVNRSGDIWHASVNCNLPFVGYGYKCKNGDTVLLDPYAKIIEDLGPGKCLGKLREERAFDWRGDLRPGLPMEKLIIYRLNVSRFTVDKSSKLPGEVSGTFSGVSEKLDHFKNLGVNAVLLEPIFPSDERKGPYYPYHLFSPRSLYGPSESMKEMVKKIHANGIEVFLEVVFTHTSEHASLREIDNSCYDNINGELNCNYPIVQQMILDSLRYWVIEFRIDGFCFVNASSLATGGNGEFLSRPPLVEAIAFDPLLSKVKIISDLWDPHGPAGTEETAFLFPHWKRWAEINTNFCVDVRNFFRGRGLISRLATRICGSGDMFLSGRGPHFSFNFITRNAGLSLVDLVSFGEGIELESECSWNCGDEGPTDRIDVLERRIKQIRNFLFVLFISLGVPVLNMGDECGQSSGGSPAYADRKPLDWNSLRSGFGIQVTQFISFLSSLRMRRGDLLQRRSYVKGDNIEWCGSEQLPPNWDDLLCKFVAMTLKAESASNVGGGDLFVAFNGGDCSEKVALPTLAVNEAWVRLVDTALSFPGFFDAEGVRVEDGLGTYEMESHSCVLFEAQSV
ncbi:isoamylase 2 chloroplastic [Phtheirospermum japonicum]|uniref:Isoamylase 2 chloroplastic n=1 Tax=Phtheirospermum japonicum TaxID=374723 RepID=A0A830C303_9LAMI|nr:isoamylase 2 chloroplastic [Phtheirospermum japonicum]